VVTVSTSSSTRYAPRYATPRNTDRQTIGDRTVAHLARLRRGPPFAWQWDVADVAGELRDDGRPGFHYQLVVLSVPRRAGKTTLNLAHNLAALDLERDMRGWYTAHRREVAAKLFRDEWLPMIDHLPSNLYRTRKSQGSEGVHKRYGSSRLQLFAPTADALHSTNADVATVDEAWHFDVERGEGVESGIRPAQLTRPWRQLWIVSAGGTIASTWWDNYLTLAELGAPRVAFFDYGADPTAPDYDPASPAVWARSHPTYGVAFESLEYDWTTRESDAAFERAYLNVWPRPSKMRAAGAVELEQWATAARPELSVTPAVYALDVAADRSAAAIVAAAVVDGVALVDVVAHRPGLGWVAGAVRDLKRVHRGVPIFADSLVAASIVAELERAHVTVEPVGVGDHAKACGTFVDRLATGTLAHRSQRVLDDAVLGAARRPLGDAWLWSRNRSNVDISPLVAATIAAWAAITRRPAGRAVMVSAPATSPSPGRSTPGMGRRSSTGRVRL
jgi:hypothetical protein